MKLPIGLVAIVLVGCASVPETIETTLSADEILGRSVAAQAGGVSRTEVAYDGEWRIFATTTQPVLTDTGYRKSSVETYRPSSGSVHQVHTGPDGTKTVKHRTEGSTSVVYNGKPATDPEVIDAAALVGDAYQLFLFGARYALQHGQDFEVTGSESISGHRCYVVSGWMPGGFGNSEGDLVRLSIDRESFVCRRVYFSINGLESTRGAEVDVTMDEFVEDPRGRLWPTWFYERVRKPVRAPAHLWETTSLVVDGVRVH